MKPYEHNVFQFLQGKLWLYNFNQKSSKLFCYYLSVRKNKTDWKA